MAMLKFGNAALITPQVCPGKWTDSKTASAKGRIVTANRDVIATYDPSKWLLSHVSIMASVDVDMAKPGDPKSNYLIKPQYSIFVNNNGDCWERALLAAASKTFLGADNYIEHVQIPSLSKGKVIDVALREVPFTKDAEGNDLTTLYVDILIATNRKHADIIQKIESNEYSAVSMGCLIAYSQCSQCGCIAEDESQACAHIRYYKRNYFYDHNGIKRIVAELCGRAEDPDSCKFIDASWVRKPAFEGAVLRNIVNLAPDLGERIQKAVAMPSFQSQPGMNLRAASESATSLVDELFAMKRNAADDVNFPEAPADTGKELKVDEPPKEEAPAEDASRFEGESGGESGGESAPEGDASLGDSLGDSLGGGGDAGAPGGGGAPAEGAPEPQINEPKTDATVDEVKELVKRQFLNQLRRDLLKEQAESEGSDRPAENESVSQNDNLARNAGLKSVLASAKETGNDRLYNGIMILASLNSPEKFTRYGYSREDMLGILHFVDKSISPEPVGADAVRALSRVKLGSGGLVPFFTEMIVETGRRPGKSEASRLASWAKLLMCFE